MSEAWQTFLKRLFSQTPETIEAFMGAHFEEAASFRLDGLDRCSEEFKFSLLNFSHQLVELVDFVHDDRVTCFRFYEHTRAFQETLEEVEEKTSECFGVCWHSKRGKIARWSHFGRDVAPEEEIWRPPRSSRQVAKRSFDSNWWRNFEIMTFDAAAMDSNAWFETYFTPDAIMRIDGKDIPMEAVRIMRDTVISDRRQKYLEQTAFASDGLSNSAICYCLDQDAESEEGAFVIHEHATFKTLDAETGKIISLNSGRRRLRPEERIWRAEEQ